MSVRGRGRLPTTRRPASPNPARRRFRSSTALWRASSSLPPLLAEGLSDGSKVPSLSLVSRARDATIASLWGVPRGPGQKPKTMRRHAPTPRTSRACRVLTTSSEGGDAVREPESARRVCARAASIARPSRMATWGKSGALSAGVRPDSSSSSVGLVGCTGPGVAGGSK